MGLLDEAIREHLELKRRRGADPTEVERLEREALGPVRRIQAESAAGEVPEMAEGEPGMVDEAAGHGHDEEFLDEPELEYATEHDYYAGEEPGLADESD